MNEYLATVVMLLFFALRCLIPFGLTLAIGYMMNRLVAGWQAEEKAQPILTSKTTCWEAKDCPPERRNQCPSFRQTNMACWEVRSQVTGALPETCLTCPLYVRPAAAHPAPAL
ncbi:MAG: hypothetical protein KA314_04410 [Chloroflexi bacterium]|nr:hypothetical protein [Chloroflexota bacterium]MBP8055056.1 hypothetical protein [Chloroflexota bacterium]